jgi:PAS domain S-box-containing protein
MMGKARDVLSAELVDLLFEQAGVGLCLVAPDGTVARANAEWLRSTGRRAEEVIGAKALDVCAPALDRDVQDRARAGAAVLVPRHPRRIGGRETWWEGRVSPVPVAGGRALLITAREVPEAASIPAEPRTGERPEVAERKRTEAALRDGASELQAVLDAVPVAVFITHDRDARDMTGNRACNELLRLPPGANLSKSAPLGAAPANFRAMRGGEEIPPEELPVQLAAARGVEVHDYEFDLVFDDGTVRHLLGSAAPLLDARGGTRGAVGAFLDITERRQAQEAVRRSEATLDAFFDASPGILSLLDERLMFLKTDPVTPSYFGLDRDAMVGRGLGELAPELAERFGPLLRRVVDAGHAGTGVETHISLPRRGRERTDWRCSYFPVPLAGGKRGLGVMGVEITDLKLAEAAVRRSEAVLAQAGKMVHVGAWWIEVADHEDLSANPLCWSDEVYRIFGYAPGEVAVTSSLFLERVHPDDRRRVQEAIARAVAERRPYRIEHRVVRPDGTVRVVLEHAEVASGGRGRPLRIVGAVLDVTDQKRVEAALRETDRQKDEFLAILAHELRNPLSAIASATHLIRARVTQGKDVERPLEILERQTRNSSRLLDDLLDISRIARAVVQLRREEVRLDAAVMSAVESQRALVDSAGHHLTVTLPHHPVFVEGDPTRLEQIFANLVNNAVKYTPARGRLSVTVEPRDGQVLVRVEDDGVGISPELLPRVFDPFVQGEQTLARSNGGLGLGLTLVQRLVELHGGSIEARSEGPGKGSTFVVRLPAKDPSRSAGRAGDAAAPPGPSRRRILLVEDNLDAAEALAEYLRTVGHEVEVVHDGAAAVDAAVRGAPEVVLLDLGLPGMDGYEVARRLRADARANAPVLIALTGYGQEEDRKRAREAGFAHHLTKPFEPDALERVLGAVGDSGSGHDTRPR